MIRKEAAELFLVTAYFENCATCQLNLVVSMCLLKKFANYFGLKY